MTDDRGGKAEACISIAGELTEVATITAIDDEVRIKTCGAGGDIEESIFGGGVGELEIAGGGAKKRAHALGWVRGESAVCGGQIVEGGDTFEDREGSVTFVIDRLGGDSLGEENQQQNQKCEILGLSHFDPVSRQEVGGASVRPSPAPSRIPGHWMRQSIRRRWPLNSLNTPLRLLY